MNMRFEERTVGRITKIVNESCSETFTKRVLLDLLLEAYTNIAFVREEAAKISPDMATLEHIVERSQNMRDILKTTFDYETYEDRNEEIDVTIHKK